MGKAITMKQMQKHKEKLERKETCACLYDSGNKDCNKPTHVVVDDNGGAWERLFASRLPRYTVQWALCLEHSKQFDALNPSVSINEFVRGYDLKGKYLEGRERKPAKT
jgi:hypothetical protein